MEKHYFLELTKISEDKELESDGETVWMNDYSDYSHPSTFCLDLGDVPELIQYLKKLYALYVSP